MKVFANNARKIADCRDELLKHQFLFYRDFQRHFSRNFDRNLGFYFSNIVFSDLNNKGRIPTEMLWDLFFRAENQVFQACIDRFRGLSDLPAFLPFYQELAFLIFFDTFLSHYQDYLEPQRQIKSNLARNICDSRREISIQLSLGEEAIDRAIAMGRGEIERTERCAFYSPLFQHLKKQNKLNDLLIDRLLNDSIQKTHRQISRIAFKEKKTGETFPNNLFREFTTHNFRHFFLSNYEDQLRVN